MECDCELSANDGLLPLQGQKMAGPGLVTTAVLLLLCWGTHQTDAQG